MSRDKEYDEYCLKAGIENRNTGTVRLGDLKHMNFQELEAMVLHHAQQIKDIAKHLLELQRYMEFKRRPLVVKQEWVGVMDEDISEMVRGTHNTGSFVRAIEALLKDKNT